MSRLDAPPPDRATQSSTGVLVLMYVLMGGQAMFFGLAPAPATRRLVGIALGVVMAMEARFPWLLGSRRTPAALLLSAALAINLLMYLNGATPPFSFRLLLAGLVTGYLMLAGLLLAGLSPRRLQQGAGRFILGVGMIIVLGEAIMSMRALEVVEGPVIWEGQPVLDEPHGDRYPAGAEFRTIYPSDPRGYFDDVDARRASWELSVHNPASRARLEFPSELASGMRVVIDTVADTTWWGIQLNEAPLPISEAHEYVLRFRARTSRPRAISVALSQGHAPWDGLGFSRAFDLDTSWRAIEESVTVSRSDSVGRLHFDLGRVPATIELADISVKREDGVGLSVVPSTRHSVRYRFNQLGCRGDDWSASTTHPRILVLGDSYALGVGVHEQDTFVRRLAELLTPQYAPAEGTVHVLNCAAAGQNPTAVEDRYRELAALVDPDVVLVAFGGLRERSWREEQSTMRRAESRKYRYLFRLLGTVTLLRTPSADSAAAAFVAPLSRMVNDAGREGHRVAVVIFDHPESTQWEGTLRAILDRLSVNGIDVIDLARELRRASARWRDLWAHPLYDNRAGVEAQAVAATETARFLRAREWLNPGRR